MKLQSQVTLKFLSGVDTAGMESGTMAEALATLLTNQKFLSCVNTWMTVKIWLEIGELQE